MYSIGMRKLLGKSNTDLTSHGSPPSGGRAGPAATAAAGGITSSPVVPNYRPAVSQDTVYAAGVPIACLDSSPDGRSAILGGRHVLKTVTVEGLTVREGLDLRSLLVAQPAMRNNNPTSVADQLSVKAVKWGEVGGKQVLFTACTTGKVFMYDLVTVGSCGAGAPVDCVQMREDSRQVNALDINPHHSTWLLSGSQDGIVRCFDVRQRTETKTGATFRSKQAFKCHADGVRHVQWNPRDGFLFACATEQGNVIKWDMRKPNAPILRISAHEKACSAMAWHPDGVHLASAGLESRCYIWDMSKQDKRQKPKWTIATPSPAGTLAWRPGQWSATAQGKRTSQLAMSYDESGQKRSGINVVHVWDLARPTMPYKEIQRFDASPCAILWHDQYLLWTAGQDGIFAQCDVSFAPKVIDRQAVSTMAFSPRGDVMMLLDERAPPPRPRPHILHHDAAVPPASVPSVPSMTSYSSSPTTPRFSVSRSDSEDDAIGTFIGPRRRSSRRRRPSTRSTTTLSTTPPAGPSMEDVMSLEQTIKATGVYRPQQAMAVGHVPAAASPEVYEYLSANYLEALYRDLPGRPGSPPLPQRIATILDHYALAATHVRQFRLAQTWRIIAYAVDLMLHRRAQYHLERRRDRNQDSMRRKSSAKPRSLVGLSDHDNLPEMSVEKVQDDLVASRKPVSNLAVYDQSLQSKSVLPSEQESTSNMPTPMVRPVPNDTAGSQTDEADRESAASVVGEPSSFTLPPPAAYPPPQLLRSRLDSVPLSVVSHDSAATYASTEGYDFYDTEFLVKAADEARSASENSPDISRKQRQDSEVGSHAWSISDQSRRPTGLSEVEEGQAARAAIVAELQKSHAQELKSYEKTNQFSEKTKTAVPPRVPLERTETTMTGMTGFTSFTSYTDKHHLISQPTDLFDSPYASQTDINLRGSSILHSIPEPASPTRPEHDKSPFVIETDYLCWSDDPPYPYSSRTSSSSSALTSSPLHPYTIISRALAFETKTSALNASAMILLLKPLLPDDVINKHQAAAILRQHHSRLMGMKLFVEAALLRKLCMQGWPGGALSSWGDNYPAVFTPAQQGVQASFLCTSCNRPHDIDRSNPNLSPDALWRCARCRSVMAPCAVCGHRDTAPSMASASPLPTHIPAKHWANLTPQQQTTDENEPKLTTWFYCPSCSHGGHASCLQAWHAALDPDFSSSEPYLYLEDPPGAESSDGCCPVDGCGHTCLPSRWRNGDAVLLRGEEISRVTREASRALARGSAVANEVGAPSSSWVGGGAGSVVGDQAGGDHTGERSGDKVMPSGGGSGAGTGALVRSDVNDVPQSRAVETVREALASAGSYVGQGAKVGTSILSSSPGRNVISGDRERRKSVKFVADERK